MKRFLLFLSIILAAAAPAAAAKIEVRNDLVAKIERLNPIFGAYSSEAFDLPVKREGLPSAKTKENAFNVIRLSGVITKGDTEKLKALVNKLVQNTWAWALVLDSPGGSFLEGIEIGEYLSYIVSSQDPNLIGVYVLNGDECLSACALAITLSTRYGELSDSENVRHIEAGGRIGFHMGMVPDKVADQQAKVSDIMNLTYDVIASYMRIIIGGSNPPELLQEALKHRTKDSFFYLTASGEAYDLGFSPVSKRGLSDALSSSALPMYKIAQMCSKLVKISQLHIDSVTQDYLGFPIANGTVNDYAKSKQGRVFLGSSHSGEHCLFGFSAKGNMLIEVLGKQAKAPSCQNGKNATSEFCAVDYDLTQFASNGLLAEINGCPGGVFEPIKSDGGAKIISVKNLMSMNMRSEPSLSSRTVAKIAKGTDMTPLDCAVSDDNQGIWSKVRAGSKIGWVSSRFLVTDYSYDWLENR